MENQLDSPELDSHRVLRIANQRAEFQKHNDGYWHWLPSRTNPVAVSESDLRILADELARRNAPRDIQLHTGLSQGSVYNIKSRARRLWDPRQKRYLTLHSLHQVVHWANTQARAIRITQYPQETDITRRVLLNLFAIVAKDHESVLPSSELLQKLLAIPFTPPQDHPTHTTTPQMSQPLADCNSKA